MIFAGMPYTPVAFLEFNLEMKVPMLSKVTGLKSKALGAGRWAVIFWMLGLFNVFRDRYRCHVLGGIYKELVHSTRNRDLV